MREVLRESTPHAPGTTPWVPCQTQYLSVCLSACLSVCLSECLSVPGRCEIHTVHTDTPRFDSPGFVNILLSHSHRHDPGRCVLSRHVITRQSVTALCDTRGRMQNDFGISGPSEKLRNARQTDFSETLDLGFQCLCYFGRCEVELLTPL